MKKLQNFITSNRKQKRDTAGKFTAGGGGLKSLKNFNWGRALPVIVIVALVGGYLVWQSFAASPITTGTWKLVWSDEFNGNAVDTSKWNVFQNSNYGSANKQDECNRAANVAVGSGSLNITAKRETVTCGGTNPDTGNKTYYFTSGALTTRAQEGPLKFKFKQGYIEARIKAPKGNPYWPAFWLVGTGESGMPAWPEYGEFDVFEGYGARPDLATGTFHYKCIVSGVTKNCNTTSGNMYNIKTDSAYQGSSNLGVKIDSATTLNAYSGGTTDYVNYGFEWDDKQITWYVNGRKVRFLNDSGLYRVEPNGSTTLEKSLTTLGKPTTDLSTIFNYEHSIILNLAFGGAGPRYSTYGYTGTETATGYDDGNLAADLPAMMQVDYVRVYQKDTTASIPAPAPAEVAVPANLQAQAIMTGASLTWDASVDTHVSGYAVRYIQSSSTNKADDAAWTHLNPTAATSQVVENLTPGVAYDFQLRAVDGTGTYAPSAYTATVVATPKPAEPIGLSATYYSRPGLTGDFVTRTDQTVDFSWGDSAPVAGIGPDFGTRWTGQIVPQQTDTYTFILKADQSAHLWINGNPLIDAQSTTPLTEQKGTIRLEAGKAYDFDLDFSDTAGNAEIHLLWKGNNVTQAVVPAKVFRPVVKSGLSARYSTRGSTVKYYLLRNDGTVNFNWTTGSPYASVPVDSFRATWVGKLRVPTSGTYKLITTSDDGTQLWINNSLLMNDWTDHSTKRNEKSIVLKAGQEYAISLRYYENAGGANVSLLWSGPGIAESVIPATALTTN